MCVIGTNFVTLKVRNLNFENSICLNFETYVQISTHFLFYT